MVTSSPCCPHGWCWCWQHSPKCHERHGLASNNFQWRRSCSPAFTDTHWCRPDPTSANVRLHLCHSDADSWERLGQSCGYSWPDGAHRDLQLPRRLDRAHRFATFSTLLIAPWLNEAIRSLCLFMLSLPRFQSLCYSDWDCLACI